MNLSTRTILPFLIAFLLSSHAAAQQNPSRLALEGTAVVKDKATLQSPSQVRLHRLLGERYRVNEDNRLLKIDEDELLDGFRHRPGRHPWIGEHVGKWLHAACLTYSCARDKQLETKIDRVANELMKTQEADGYLGTYAPGSRFCFCPNAEWDVWAHKYCLIGLLTYYQLTGNKEALGTCKRVGDLLINTFGPGKANIVDSGWHYGMAPSSVLEPIVLLYRATGDKRYLDFAEHIIATWDVRDQPRLLSGLLAGKTVNIAGGGKAYEQTSCLAGLCELYRVTDKKDYLRAVLNAWDDITRNRLYITGSGSREELWPPDNDFPNDMASRPCETCVTVTWMQLNMQLFRLLGESKFLDEFEKSLYNHLLAAQKPTGDDWAGYTPLEGKKEFYSHTTCCHSSGPRGIALLPTMVYSVNKDGVSVNLFTSSRATVRLPSGGAVELAQDTGYPFHGNIRLIVTPKAVSRPFAIRFRAPSWSPRVSIGLNGKPFSLKPKAGYVTIKRAWKRGDSIIYKIDMAPRTVLGDHGNAGKMALLYGPLVLAADRTHNPQADETLSNISPSIDKARLIPACSPIQPVWASTFTLGFETDGLLLAPDTGKPSPCKLFLRPFYEAGSDGSAFKVWLRRPGTLTFALQQVKM